MAAPTPLRDDETDGASPTDTIPNESQERVSHETETTLGCYAATVVHYEGAPDECTIYPTDVADAELVTTWISAQEGSYVSLAEMG
ncbi:hypothetical protein SAMN04487949_3030 [Halogranum gelatinilyticum]|uniref:DUF7511 domain-containing protein n=1 Tax=Halogranum gelatinilyticum TaxID=660521 RepID=A0A1G9XKH8_9EURY|nr:hypothetical protein [Halogranum gelatinilyticum]SDM97284.1 hypothetical protein SAMN04487949_3030 [Halogranum gelatinilyticum]